MGGLSHAQADAPACFIEKHRGALRVSSVDQAALGLGIAPGLTLADARARVPQLAAIESDHRADDAWLERIALFCDRYTPMVARDAPHGLILDITGCTHLFGGEQPMREDLVVRLSHKLSQVRTAIADTPQAARALARFGSGDAIALPGRQADAVSMLPVSALEAAADVTHALGRAGLKSIDDLARRPRPPLAARFGEGLIIRLARVLGEYNTGITPDRPLPPCSAERRFAEPLSRMDDVLETLKALTGQAAQCLERRGEGGRRFEAALYRADGAVSRLVIETAQPVRAPRIVMRLFGERIDTLSEPLDPGHGYDLIRLSVRVAAPLSTAQASLDGRENDDAHIDGLIDRLSTRFGRRAIEGFAPVRTHIPEHAAKSVPAGEAAGPAPWPSREAGARPRRPIHLFERPEPIEALAEIPDGPPLRFRWRRVMHDIARAEGPERIAPEWWRTDGDSPTRDYYCVENAKGHRFWVFREGLYHEAGQHPRWFLHGLFA